MGTTAALLPAAAAVPERPHLAVPTLAQAPAIDGVIDPKEWSGASTLDQPLVQFEPEQGVASPYRTVIHVAQTPTALYVAFVAWDPDASRIAAAVTARDGDLDDDDSVTVLVDTFLDGRTAYSFSTNALGTQADGRIADNGRTVDELWDAAWSCAGRRFEDRWSAEFEIPFSILRFPPGQDRTWGVSFLRTVPRRFETSLWPTPTENRFRVSNFGTLTGLDLERTEEKRWLAIPYVQGNVDEDGRSNLEVGGDFRWRPTSALGVDLTINPDFALVEADVEQINLSRFDLFIPERRPFFLEGSETFQQRIRQFYSRRIGEITWGSKAIGTFGGTGFQALATSEDLELETGETERADYAVVRTQHSLPRGSTIGLLAANRRLSDEDQGSVGLDATLFFTDTLGLTAQFLSVHGPTADGGLAWFVRPAYDSNRTHFHVRYTNLDDGIRDDFNAVGFLRDDDRREWDTNLSHTFWLEGRVERVEADVNYNRFDGQSGELRSEELEAELEVVLRSQWELELEYTDEFQLFERPFDNERLEARAGWDSRDGRSIFGFVGTGENFDNDLTLYGAEVEWAFGDRLRLSYEVTRLELDPDPEGDTTWIHVLDGEYYFTPNRFIRLFAQTNTSIDKTNVQAVYVWRYRPPFGSLQIAYQTGTSEQGEVSDQGDTLFAKLAWVF